MSFGGPVSINQVAIWEFLDRYEVPNPTDVFEKVIAVASAIIHDMNEDAAAEREAKKTAR